MDVSAIMATIYDVEDALPVDQWTVGDVEVWPVMRGLLYWQLFGGTPPGSSVPTTHGGWNGFRRQLNRVLTGWGGWGVARVLDRANNAAPHHPADVVFLGDNVSRGRLHTGWYDRHWGPIRQRLNQRGIRTSAWEPHHIYRYPRDGSSAWIEPYLDVERVRARVRRRIVRSYLPGIEELASDLEAQVPDPWLLTAASAAYHGAFIAAAAERFVPWLRRSGARAAFLVDYNPTSMAFNLACRRLALPTVEIQHGVQGPFHWAYAPWGRSPQGGFAVLPQWYWCWSEEEAELINGWSQEVIGRPAAVVGGNPWLDLWLRGSAPVVDRYDREIRSSERLGTGELTVLVTLNNQTDDLALYESAIRESPRSWRWWIRCHPTSGPAVQSAIEDRFAGITGADMKRLADLPLYALLREADVHVTTNSSTVLEARRFGIPSVLTSDDATLLFEEAIDAGWAVTARTGVAIVRAIEGQEHLDLAPEAPTDGVDAALAELSGRLGGFLSGRHGGER